jgi:hypothetical protein
MSNVRRYGVTGQPIPARNRGFDQVQLSEEEAADPAALAAAFARLSEQISRLAAGLPPQAVEFLVDEFGGTSTDKLNLEHGLGNRVNWWVSGADSDSAVIAWENASESTDNVLALYMDNSANTPRLVSFMVQVAA